MNNSGKEAPSEASPGASADGKVSPPVSKDATEAKEAEQAKEAVPMVADMAEPPTRPRQSQLPRLHPWPVRLMHWTNAIAMIIMIMSGWGIYNDYVIIPGLHFAEDFRLGTWAAPSLLWHFAGMWLLALNGLCYLTYGLITGRLRRRLLPIRLEEVVQTVRDTLHFKIEHNDLTVYNAVQKLLYLVVILAGISQVVTGLLVWKPIQFSAAVALLGGFQAVRIEHFLGMSVIVGFLIVHVALSLLVPQTLWAMLSGGPHLPAEEKS